MGGILYFYIFKDKELNIIECKRINMDKYYLDNGKTRTRDEEKHPNNVAYGNTKEIIMYSNTKNNIDEYGKSGGENQTTEGREKCDYYGALLSNI